MKNSESQPQQPQLVINLGTYKGKAYVQFKLKEATDSLILNIAEAQRIGLELIYATMSYQKKLEKFLKEDKEMDKKTDK